MPFRLLAALCVAVALLLPRAVPAGIPTLKLAVLEFGTVAWELATIEALGLDTANGFDLEVQGYASSQAGRVAFLGGTADAMVADWLWVARQRAAGEAVVFLPYSRAVGGILVPGDSDIDTLADLDGRTIGIAGGPLDKSWLILRAYAARQGIELTESTEQVFAAPPLLNEKVRTGELDAIVSYWHFTARLEAQGFRWLVDVSDAAEALGLDPRTPLLGYVFHEAFAAENRELVAGFARASRAAKEALRDDAHWERLRPLMRVEDEAEFEALKAGFRAGIPAPDPVDVEAAARMFALMAGLGGRELTGEATELPDGVFLDP